MNTLAYIKLNRVTGEEIEQGKRNAWLFVRVNEDDNSAEAIALMRLFSSVCESEGFHIRFARDGCVARRRESAATKMRRAA